MTTSARAWAARVMVMRMRVAGNEEGKGGKAMTMATRVAGEQTVMATKRVMVTKIRLGVAGGSNDQPLHATRQ